MENEETKQVPFASAYGFWPYVNADGIYWWWIIHELTGIHFAWCAMCASNILERETKESSSNGRLSENARWYHSRVSACIRQRGRLQSGENNRWPRWWPFARMPLGRYPGKMVLVVYVCCINLATNVTRSCPICWTGLLVLKIKTWARDQSRYWIPRYYEESPSRCRQILFPCLCWNIFKACQVRIGRAQKEINYL